MAARIAGGRGRHRAFAAARGRDRLPPLMSAQNTPSAWTPLLATDEAASALRVVDEIAATLRETLGEPRQEEPTWLRRGPSVAGGDAGLACFFTYLDAVRPGEGYDDLAMELLER